MDSVIKYTVYKTTNQINGKYYIGCHKTINVDDDYLGSGHLLKDAVTKYGIENFTKEILFVFDNSEEMYNKEKELVTESLVIDNMCYNLCTGGYGGQTYTKVPDSELLSEATKANSLHELFESVNLPNKQWNRKRLKLLIGESSYEELKRKSKISRSQSTAKSRKEREELKQKYKEKNKQNELAQKLLKRKQKEIEAKTEHNIKLQQTREKRKQNAEIEKDKIIEVSREVNSVAELVCACGFSENNYDAIVRRIGKDCYEDLRLYYDSFAVNNAGKRYTRQDFVNSLLNFNNIGDLLESFGFSNGSYSVVKRLFGFEEYNKILDDYSKTNTSINNRSGVS